MSIGKLIIVLVSILFPSGSLMSQNELYVSKTVSFTTLDQEFILDGILKAPKNNSSIKACIILVSPPFNFDRHYLGMFDSISIFLVKRGYAVFQYGNRNFKYKNLPNRISMHKQVSDAITGLINRIKTAIKNNPTTSLDDLIF